MSRQFRHRWERDELGSRIERASLHPRLRAVVHAPFTRRGSALLLAPLVSGATSRNSFEDATAYEAFINKIHIADYFDASRPRDQEMLMELVIQGVKAALELATRLQRQGNYRVLLSLDVDVPTVTLRFFSRRGRSWGADDPDDFRHEEILMIDTAWSNHH